ncbi:MAG: hypothetical protein A3J29_07685 [Acidobacteria bacterium RIFCSPLOWO2_12_FULL_67_14b]|nr:MAG: hypothetical protein A3J29_07685 [Acidobacteria bacterium RIFCSPLOWO2_12_FULL_67_14b]
MEDLLANLLQSAPDQRRLLGGWRDILDDIRDLCRNLNALPDQCECGDGASHLNGACVCCSAPHAGRIPICADCGTLLARLRPRIVTLAVDTMRFFPVVRILLQSPELGPARAAGEHVEHHIAAVMRMFDRLVLEAGEFQEGCRASHLRVLKDTAAALLMESDRLGTRLENTRDL